jgi:hypothetical protein
LDTVYIALVTGDPTDEDWVEVNWTRVAPPTPPAGVTSTAAIYHLSTEFRWFKITAFDDAGDTDFAWVKFLCGPASGDVSWPSAGSPNLYCKISDSPEVPVLPIGAMKVT